VRNTLKMKLPYCAECLVEVNGKMYCREDLNKTFEEAENNKRSNQPQPTIVINNDNDNQNYNNSGYDSKS
jgi:hypothetical protein